jgi:DNA-binding response OmpR family regulator
MLIELNRFFTTEEVRRQYRVPAAVADEILPELPVFVTQEDGTRFHLESEVDEFLADLSCKRRKTDVLNSPSPNGTSSYADKLTYGPIEVNKAENEATVDGKTYPLDLVRLEVLACLVARKGEWVTRKEMQERSRILKDEQHLERIIKALKKTVPSLSYLIASSSRGYRLVLPKKLG